MNKLQIMEQMGKALQMFAASLGEEKAVEVAGVFPKYEPGKVYSMGDYFTYGENSTGDPQLYKVVQSHTSQAEWIPSENPALYTPLGLNSEGIPVWSKPSGSHDAYNTGDMVDYKGTIYKSLINGNVYSPEEYPAGWGAVE